MDLKVKPFDFNAALARAGLGRDGLPVARAPATGSVSNGGFQAAMTQALNRVSQDQLKVQQAQREVALGNPTVGLEETMVAGVKAQLGFQAALQVRNRLVQAYTEIMNMNV
jgi:flagellar hook-basal body complex protein FliE